MKNSEFIALLIANTNKTKNIRTYGSKWFSGARRINDAILCEFGHVIALIQAKIDEGCIIDKHTEHILLYNVQPLFGNNSNSKRIASNGNDDGKSSVYELSPNVFYITLDMVVKAICDVDNTHTLFGAPMQLVVDAATGEVMNNTKAMIHIGLIVPEDTDDNDDAPISYGSYHLYHAVCGFVALSSSVYFDTDDIFSGKLDRSDMVINATAYDSLTEVFAEFDRKDKNFNWAGELKTCKESLPTLKEQGISKSIIKMISPNMNTVEITPHPEIHAIEARIDDELMYLQLANEEPSLTEEEQVVGSF